MPTDVTNPGLRTPELTVQPANWLRLEVPHPNHRRRSHLPTPAIPVHQPTRRGQAVAHPQSDEPQRRPTQKACDAILLVGSPKFWRPTDPKSTSEQEPARAPHQMRRRTLRFQEPSPERNQLAARRSRFACSSPFDLNPSDIIPGRSEEPQVIRSKNRARRTGRCAGMPYHGYVTAHTVTTAETQAEIDAAWRAELQRRVDDVESGRVDLVSHDETVALARALLAGRK